MGLPKMPGLGRRLVCGVRRATGTRLGERTWGRGWIFYGGWTWSYLITVRLRVASALRRSKFVASPQRLLGGVTRAAAVRRVGGASGLDGGPEDWDDRTLLQAQRYRVRGGILRELVRRTKCQGSNLDQGGRDGMRDRAVWNVPRLCFGQRI
jgi:hypothetical protein